MNIEQELYGMYNLCLVALVNITVSLKIFNIQSRAFCQSLLKQSVQYLAYMWLESMLKLQIRQVQTSIFKPLNLELEHELGHRLKKFLSKVFSVAL